MKKWIEITVVSLLLAILLRAGLGVPVLSTFIALSIIYVTHLVMAQMETGVTTALGWVKSSGNVAMGVVIFLAIRFIAAKVLGLYPIETYGAIDASGGLVGILPGQDVSSVILWEICFAMVAGQITVMWVKGTHKMPVRIIIVTSLMILTLQIAYPKYTASWASRDEVSDTLVNHGVVGSAVKGVWVFMFGRPTPPPAHPTTQVVATAKTAETLKREVTPCSIHIKKGKFDIWTDGHPVWIKFNGVQEWVSYPGQGDFQAPSGILPGEMLIVSSDPEYPNIRVQVVNSDQN